MSWKDTLKKNIFDEDPEDMTDFMNVTPRMKREAERRRARKITTKDSTGQDEEAAKRTEDKEADLLAMFRERNKANREKLNQPVEKLIEWVEG
jgi:hypothetical protein